MTPTAADFTKRLDQTAEDTEALLSKLLSDTLMPGEIARPDPRRGEHTPAREPRGTQVGLHHRQGHPQLHGSTLPPPIRLSRLRRREAVGPQTNRGRGEAQKDAVETPSPSIWTTLPVELTIRTVPLFGVAKCPTLTSRLPGLPAVFTFASSVLSR